MISHRLSSLGIILLLFLFPLVFIGCSADGKSDAVLASDTSMVSRAEADRNTIVPTSTPVPEPSKEPSPYPTETPVPSVTSTPVPSPAEVVPAEEISFYEDEIRIHIDEKMDLRVELLPDNTTDTLLVWTSSDESVVTVSDTGTVSGVGFGDAEITVSTSNGLSDTCHIFVSYAKRTLDLKYKFHREDDNNIGKEWNYVVEINGKTAVNGPVDLSVGDVLEFYVKAVESDVKPDVGENTVTHTVTEEDLAEGFTVEVEVTVTENGGRNYGLSAEFIYEFIYSVDQ